MKALKRMEAGSESKCITSIALTFDDTNEVNFPKGGEVMNVLPSNQPSVSVPVLLVLADRHAPTEQRTFYVTKFAIRSDLDLDYIGSCTDPAGAGFCHVFEVVERDRVQAAA
jgi:hypothetical protein